MQMIAVCIWQSANIYCSCTLKTYYNYTGLKVTLKSKLSYLEAKTVETQTDLDQSQI